MDRLADLLAFGKLQPCEVCKTGQFVFGKGGYVCKGDLSEWSKCNAIVKEPKRAPCRVPKDIADTYPFLKKYKYVKRVRIFKEVNLVDKLTVKKEEDEVDSK